MSMRALASRLWRLLVRRPLGKLLHATRRRAAIRRIRGRKGNFKSVLFICHGNICRSPYAAASFRRFRTGELAGIQVDSAGFHLPGRPPPPTAIQAASRRGVDLSAHRSQQLDRGLARNPDLIVVMEVRQAQRIRSAFGRSWDDLLILADLLPTFGDARMIRDPLDQPLETFEKVYDEIDACLAVLRSALSSGEGR